MNVIIAVCSANYQRLVIYEDNIIRALFCSRAASENLMCIAWRQTVFAVRDSVAKYLWYVVQASYWYAFFCPAKHLLLDHNLWSYSSTNGLHNRFEKKWREILRRTEDFHVTRQVDTTGYGEMNGWPHSMHSSLYTEGRTHHFALPRLIILNELSNMLSRIMPFSATGLMYKRNRGNSNAYYESALGSGRHFHGK